MMKRDSLSGKGMEQSQKCLWYLGSTLKEPAEGFMEAICWHLSMSLRVSLLMSYQC